MHAGRPGPGIQILSLRGSASDSSLAFGEGCRDSARDPASSEVAWEGFSLTPASVFQKALETNKAPKLFGVVGSECAPPDLQTLLLCSVRRGRRVSMSDSSRRHARWLVMPGALAIKEARDFDLT